MEDCDLIVECQQGNRLAFEALVKRYQKTVFSILYQLAPDWDDIADLVQEVFIRVYRYINNLRNPKTFRAWLNQITVNLFYDELRKKPKRINAISLDKPVGNNEDDSLREVPDFRPKADEVVLNRELATFIKKSMQELPEQFRVVIVLRELQGLSYEEISAALGCELGTVKSRLARARLRLQSLLRGYLDQNPANSKFFLKSL